MLSTRLARWIMLTFEDVEVYSAQRLGLVDAKDPPIFRIAREMNAAVLTKDSDFADEVRRRGSPAVIQIRSGNASTRTLRPLLEEHLPKAFDALRSGQTLIEIPGPESHG